MYSDLGLSNPPKPPADLTAIAAYFNTSAWGGAAEKPFQTAIEAEITKLEGLSPEGTLTDLQTWLTSLGDLKTAYPGLTDPDVANIYAELQMTPPPPTDPLVAIAAFFNTWGGAPEKPFQTAIEAEIATLQGTVPKGTLTDLQTWVKNQDLYTVYPGLTGDDVKAIYTELTMTNPPTPPVTPLQAFENDLATWKASGTDGEKAFANGFPIAAGATLAQVQASITALGQGIYTKYPPGLSQADVQKIYTDLTMTNPPAPPVEPTLAEIATYFQTWGADKGAKQFASDIEAEITSLGPSGTVAQLQNWMTTMAGSLDLYTEYPGITQPEVQSIYTELDNLANPPAPLANPNADLTAQAGAFLGWGTNPGAKQFANDIRKEAATLQLQGKSLADLKAWLVTQGTKGLSSLYPGITVTDVTKSTKMSLTCRFLRLAPLHLETLLPLRPFSRTGALMQGQSSLQAISRLR
jgi:hypothetical protein